MEPYQERFVKEYFELKNRTEKLGNMLSAYLADELNFTPICGYNMLHEQYVHMKKLFKCIGTKSENRMY